MNKYILKLIVKATYALFPVEHPEWLSYKLLGLSDELYEDYGLYGICCRGDNLTISVCTFDYNIAIYPYIIVYNNSEEYLATKCARISLVEPKYITTKSYGLKGSWKLNQKEIQELISLLNAEPMYPEITPFKNNYEYALHLYETMVEGIGCVCECKHPLKLDMPDYTKLK